MSASQSISGGGKLLSSLLICLMLIIALTFNSRSEAEWAEQSCSFPHRIPVTITASAAGHNTETRIDLVDTDFPAAYIFSPAGDDVRVFESDTPHPLISSSRNGTMSPARLAFMYAILWRPAPRKRFTFTLATMASRRVVMPPLYFPMLG